MWVSTTTTLHFTVVHRIVLFFCLSDIFHHLMKLKGTFIKQTFIKQTIFFVYTRISFWNVFLCCTSLWGVSGCHWESFMAAIHCQVIINDLLSRLIMSILQEDDLQADLDPAGTHQVLTEHCNRQFRHTLSSVLLRLISFFFFFCLKWIPIIVLFLSSLLSVILLA